METKTKCLHQNLKDLIEKSQILKKILTSVKNWYPQLAGKLNEVISPKIWIKSKQMIINDIFIILHLKPIPLLN